MISASARQDLERNGKVVGLGQWDSLPLILHAFVRVVRIVAICGWHSSAAIPALLRAVRRPNDSATIEDLGRRLASLFEALGPTFIKIGQTLGNRSDLARDELLRPLRRLHDNVRPMSAGAAMRVLVSAYGEDFFQLFDGFISEPIATGSIAQVHQARCRAEGLDVALKIKRPHVDETIRADLQLIRLAANLMILIPAFRGIPVIEAIDEVARAIQQQTDFSCEVTSALRFHADMAGFPEIVIPKPIPHLCRDRVIVMTFLPGLRRLDDATLGRRERQQLLETGLKFLYRMIFTTGFIHCDLHPGNLMIGANQTIALLDHGLVAELDENSKAMFRDFFLGIVFNEGRECAAILKKTATSISQSFDSIEFEAEVCALIAKTSARRANEFQVSHFAMALFDIQRRHGVRGSTQFTMAILSLLMFEGLAKQFHPSLDFQRHAMPFLAVSLARRIGQPPGNIGITLSP